MKNKSLHHFFKINSESKGSSLVLFAAALYNIIWGAVAILWPNKVFTLAGLDIPNYPELWQCIGMIVGVYGIGYFLAAHDPTKHWPIVLVGLLGKVFGPIGFVWAILQGRFNISFGGVIVLNDLIWWIPFAYILRLAWKK